MVNLLLFFLVHTYVCRALDKMKYLMIIWDNFSYFSLKPYVVTPHLSLLVETVQMRAHNIHFCAKLIKIIPNYHQILPLISVCVWMTKALLHQHNVAGWSISSSLDPFSYVLAKICYRGKTCKIVNFCPQVFSLTLSSETQPNLIPWLERVWKNFVSDFCVFWNRVFPQLIKGNLFLFKLDCFSQVSSLARPSDWGMFSGE